MRMSNSGGTQWRRALAGAVQRLASSPEARGVMADSIWPQALAAIFGRSRQCGSTRSPESLVSVFETRRCNDLAAYKLVADGITDTLQGSHFLSDEFSRVAQHLPHQLDIAQSA